MTFVEVDFHPPRQFGRGAKTALQSFRADAACDWGDGEGGRGRGARARARGAGPRAAGARPGGLGWSFSAQPEGLCGMRKIIGGHADAENLKFHPDALFCEIMAAPHKYWQPPSPTQTIRRPRTELMSCQGNAWRTFKGFIENGLEHAAEPGGCLPIPKLPREPRIEVQRQQRTGRFPTE